MDTVRTSFSVIKRCRKIIWKSVRKYCLPSCIHHSTAKCTNNYTKNNVVNGMMITVAGNQMHEKLTATKINGNCETEQILVVNSSNTEEVREPGTSDLEVQSPNVIEEVGKKKKKRGNRRRCSNAKSQNAIREEIVCKIIDGDKTKSIDQFPNSPKTETALAETVTNNVPSGDEHVKNETAERSAVPELDNAYQSGADNHSQTSTASTETVSWRVNRVTNDATELSGMRKFGNSYKSHADQHSQTQSRIIISSTGEGDTRKKVVHMYLTSNKNVTLGRTENAWVPAIATRQTMTDTDGTNGGVTITTSESKMTEEINKNVQSILNKITPENADELIKRFMTLPINTIERIENAANLVFEKAIQEQGFAPLYAALCSKMQNVKVTCTQSNTTTSLKLTIIKKCQSLFKSDKSNENSSVKIQEEINLCSDPEKKKELELELKENERRLHKRSVGNCCFIGQLFNQHIFNLNIIQYCIAYLICQRSDDPIECLCNLLRVCGKELERWCNLDDTFNNLKDLEYVKSLSLRIRFMIQATVELRKNKWIPRRLDMENKKTFKVENSCGGSINRPAAVVANVMLPKSDGCKQARSHLSSEKSENSLKITTSSTRFCKDGQ